MKKKICFVQDNICFSSVCMLSTEIPKNKLKALDQFVRFVVTIKILKNIERKQIEACKKNVNKRFTDSLSGTKERKELIMRDME